MEETIQEAGRRAMCAALQQAVRSYEAAHATCPHCGGEQSQSQSQGTVARRVVTRFGWVALHLWRQRCQNCGRRYRPAAPCEAALAGGNVTPALGVACALAGASWAYATAARVLHELSGAQVSAEEVRCWTNHLGDVEYCLPVTRAHLVEWLQRMRTHASPAEPAAEPAIRALCG